MTDEQTGGDAQLKRMMQVHSLQSSISFDTCECAISYITLIPGACASWFVMLGISHIWMDPHHNALQPFWPKFSGASILGGFFSLSSALTLESLALLLSMAFCPSFLFILG